MAEQPLPYRFQASPRNAASFEQALRHGANCEMVCHLGIFALLGVKLPRRLLAYEMLMSSKVLVDAPKQGILGSLVIFGPNDPVEVRNFVPVYDGTGDLINWSQGCPAQHVGMAVGETEGGEPLILDSSHVSGTMQVRRLGQIISYPDHSYVQRWARLAATPRAQN